MTDGNRFYRFTALGRSGQRVDVDQLMQLLAAADDLATTKLVDYALSLVETHEGKEQVKHYLFHGSQTQRNYAALYFKRRGVDEIVETALAMGLIDREQALAK